MRTPDLLPQDGKFLEITGWLIYNTSNDLLESEEGCIMKKIREFSDRSPILFSLAFTVLVLLVHEAFANFFYLFAQHTNRVVYVVGIGFNQIFKAVFT